MNKIKLTIMLLSTLVIVNSAMAKDSQNDTIRNMGQPSKMAKQRFTPIFIGKAEAANILAKKDSYIEVLSPFDWRAIYKSDKPLNEQSRLAFMKPKMRDWTTVQKQKIIDGVMTLNKKLSDININYPNEIKFILTNGRDAGVPYTRGQYIVFPTYFVNDTNQEKLNFIVAHEFFHVFSRYNKQIRPKLYGIINFKTVNKINYPRSIKPLLMSNPDAPNNLSYFTTNYQGALMNFVPMVYADQPYDKNKKAHFFQYMQTKLMAVSKHGSTLNPVLKNGKPILLNFNELPIYQKTITGGNTDYLIHPEEVLADNFGFFISGEKVKSPWVIKKLLKVMQGN